MKALEFIETEIGNAHDNPNIDNEILAELLEKYAEAKAGQVNAIVIGSLPDEEAIESKALDYIEDQVYISISEGHNTCREWAFIAGAKWMRDLIGNEQ